MAEKKNVSGAGNDDIIAKAQDFWTRYQKQLTIALTVILLAVGGWFGYKNFVQKPKAAKAVDAMFKAEEYYTMDSLQKALNGDGINWGFLRVIKEYGGTETGNLAHFYAGSSYLRLGDFNNAVKHLKDFSTSQEMLQARAYKLLGDAYSELENMMRRSASIRKQPIILLKTNIILQSIYFMPHLLPKKLVKTMKQLNYTK